MPEPLTIEAHAKVNAFLRVLAREDDGWHGLETLFVLVDLHDTLSAEARPGGKVTLAVEGETALGPVDDNLVVALLPFFTWAEGGRVEVAVFASGRGVVERRTFRVEAVEVVNIPLGAFAAYRVSYTGGEAPGTYWIERDAPHRVLKFGPAGVPLEFVRVR